MKKLSNEFMEKILNDSAWKELSGDFQWTEQMLEKHKTKVDWKEIFLGKNIYVRKMERLYHLIRLYKTRSWWE